MGGGAREGGGVLGWPGGFPDELALEQRPSRSRGPSCRPSLNV